MLLLLCVVCMWLVFNGTVLSHKLRILCMKLNAEQYSKGGKADVQYYRLLLHACTEFPLQLVALNNPGSLGFR